MYHQVRYTRDTTLSLPQSNDVFRLKKIHKKLTVEEYGKNMRTCLSKVQCLFKVTLNDFDSAVKSVYTDTFTEIS